MSVQKKQKKKQCRIFLKILKCLISLEIFQSCRITKRYCRPRLIEIEEREQWMQGGMETGIVRAA